MHKQEINLHLWYFLFSNKLVSFIYHLNTTGFQQGSLICMSYHTHAALLPLLHWISLLFIHIYK